ncbi:PucR family transcriptional regulator [Leucobacter triazinivorans]|uniref:PucR family transcriptional regulator n=1 Tax=Leucobacter triazinivorans TaxID=1784719 RepID=A0A4P6KDU4_9MICO|nr:PucR family transcriptional regulator [Leucobacter triazinivorans]QBE48353.1 PucR family transcriptional regulator [Leucobacter triazinivorans]
MATLSQLLALPDLGLRLIQAGPGDPEISWSSTTELLDLSGYLEGGEIILTTGLALQLDDPRWRDFVASLSRARVAAIGFGIGVNHDRIPPRLTRAASEYRVALFEIPLPVPFIAVTKAIAALVRSDELRAARAALQAQQRLLDGARSDRDPAEVLASIAQVTGKHLALVGSDGAVLASTGGFAAARKASGAEHIDLDRRSSLQLAVAGDAPLTPEGHAVIAAGSMVLGLGLRGDSADATRERGRWERLTASLLDGTGSPEALAILDPELRLPPRLRAIAVQGNAEDIAEWRRRPRNGFDRLIAPGDTVPETPGLARAWQLCPDTEDALERVLAAAAAHDLDAVIGRPAAPAEAPLSRRSASAGLRGLSQTAPLYTAPRVPEAVWTDRDAPLLEALLELSATRESGASRRAPLGGRSAEAPGSPERRALSAAVLGPLSRHDERLGPEDREMLRTTLRTVFETDGQRGPAAATLGIHRNTLRDRITRIEGLVRRSLANADDRAELWFALRLEELSGPAG